VAASLVALGVVLVAPGRGTDRGGSPPATAPPPSVSTTTRPTPPAPPALPFTAGSLPAGYTLDTWYIGPGWSSASWIGKADFEQVVVDLRDVPQQGGEYLVDEPTTIGGRPGRFRKLAPDKGLVEFIWQFEDGRWFVVSGSQREVGLPALRAVADGLTPQPAPVPAPSGLMLGQLPDGYRMEIQSGVGPVFVSMMLCRTRPDLSAGTPADCIGITLSEGVAPAYQESRGRDGATTRIPVDQESVVGRVEPGVRRRNAGLPAARPRALGGGGFPGCRGRAAQAGGFGGSSSIIRIGWSVPTTLVTNRLPRPPGSAPSVDVRGVTRVRTTIATAAALGLLSLVTACGGTSTAGSPASGPSSAAPADTATSGSAGSPAPVGGAGCPVGEYQVVKITGKSGAQVNGVPVTAKSGGGFTLALTADGKWTLTGNNATVTMEAAGLSVDATVNGTAEGDYAKVGANYGFRQGHATGKVTLKKPVAGVSSWPMDQVGPALAPGGQATLTCGQGTLALESESVTMDLKSTGGGASGGGGGSTPTPTGGGSSGGATLTLVDSAMTKTIDCAGRNVAITGSSNKYTFTGSCGELSVMGSKNDIKLATVAAVTVSGSFNHVTWSGGNPKTSNAGTGNSLGQS
jgi:hypothetical protein